MTAPTVTVSLPITDAAAAAGVSDATIRAAIRTGALTAHYPTSKGLILVEDLRAWVMAAPTERAS